MNYLFKFKSLLLLCFVLQACSIAEKTDIDKTDEEKVNTVKTDQTKKKGIVLIDDNGKLGDIFKSGGDEIGSVNKYLWCLAAVKHHDPHNFMMARYALVSQLLIHAQSVSQ